MVESRRREGVDLLVRTDEHRIRNAPHDSDGNDLERPACKPTQEGTPARDRWGWTRFSDRVIKYLESIT
jgi:hypothetical protein